MDFLLNRRNKQLEAKLNETQEAKQTPQKQLNAMKAPRKNVD